MRSAKTLAIVLTIVVAIVLTAVYASRQEPNPSERCVQSLASLAKAAGAPFTSAGDRIQIGSKDVRLVAQIENEERADAKFLVGLRVDVLVGEVPQPFTFGSVGVGSNRDDAIATDVFEWSQYVGRALLGALGVKSSDLPQSVGPFLVYPGLTGIRGSGGVWSAEKDRQLLHHLETIIQGLNRSSGEFHSISLMLAVRVNGILEGECRVDGVVSPAALTAIQSFAWGQNGTEYIFKQFYALRRR
jgi:hypothetical protein